MLPGTMETTLKASTNPNPLNSTEEEQWYNYRILSATTAIQYTLFSLIFEKHLKNMLQL